MTISITPDDVDIGGHGGDCGAAVAGATNMTGANCCTLGAGGAEAWSFALPLPDRAALRAETGSVGDAAASKIGRAHV